MLVKIEFATLLKKRPVLLSVMSPLFEAITESVTVISTPVSVMSPALVRRLPSTFTLLPALSVMLPSSPVPPPNVETILRFTLMSLIALSVRLPSPTHTMSEFTLMLPSCGPVAAVVKITSPPNERVNDSASAPKKPILMFVGSRRSVPASPSGALRSARPKYSSTSAEETSTNAPSPPLTPPLPKMLPEKMVERSDHTTAVPALPCLKAFTLMLLPSAAVTYDARKRLPFPSKSPPILTLPPPMSPLASISAVAVNSMLSPVTVTLPPVSPSPLPDASTLPATRT